MSIEESRETFKKIVNDTKLGTEFDSSNLEKEFAESRVARIAFGYIMYEQANKNNMDYGQMSAGLDSYIKHTIGKKKLEREPKFTNEFVKFIGGRLRQEKPCPPGEMRKVIEHADDEHLYRVASMFFEPHARKLTIYDIHFINFIHDIEACMKKHPEMKPTTWHEFAAMAFVGDNLSLSNLDIMKSGYRAFNNDDAFMAALKRMLKEDAFTGEVTESEEEEEGDEEKEESPEKGGDTGGDGEESSDSESEESSKKGGDTSGDGEESSDSESEESSKKGGSDTGGDGKESQESDGDSDTRSAYRAQVDALNDLKLLPKLNGDNEDYVPHAKRTFDAAMCSKIEKDASKTVEQCEYAIHTVDEYLFPIANNDPVTEEQFTKALETLERMGVFIPEYTTAFIVNISRRVNDHKPQLAEMSKRANEYIKTAEKEIENMKDYQDWFKP